MVFDTATGGFSASYQQSADVTAPTVLFFNKELYYPNGYDLSAENSLKTKPTITFPEENKAEILFDA